MKIKLTGNLDDVAITIEIERPDERGPDTWTGFCETWHCTVECNDAEYRRYQSFSADSWVELGDVSEWIANQVTYAKKVDSGLLARLYRFGFSVQCIAALCTNLTTPEANTD